MENNKGYLRQFGIIFIISAIAGIASVVIIGNKLLVKPDSGFYYQFIRLSPIVLYFINTGIATEKWKAVTGSIVSFTIIIIAEHFLFTAKNHPEISNGWAYFLQDFFYLLPYFIFFLFIKTETKKLLIIFFVLMLVFGTTGLYQSQDGFEWISELFSVHLNIPEKAWAVSRYIISQLLHVILMCELLNYAIGKADNFQPRLINPGNEYNKLNSTILFWSLKTFLYLSVLGCMVMLRSYSGFFNDYYDSSYSFLKWYYLFNMLMTTGMLLACAWYLRKFLLEYFLVYNFSSRFLYWLLLLPVIGFFVWLILLADSEKQTAYKDRKKSMEDLAASNAGGIIVVFIVLIILRLFISLMSGQTGAFFTNLLTGLLFWLLTSSRAGYYINLYLNFLLLVAFMVLPFFDAQKDITAILFPLLLLNTVQLVLIFPAFHFDAFSYISYDNDEKPWQPGDDLF